MRYVLLDQLGEGVTDDLLGRRVPVVESARVITFVCLAGLLLAHRTSRSDLHLSVRLLDSFRRRITHPSKEHRDARDVLIACCRGLHRFACNFTGAPSPASLLRSASVSLPIDLSSPRVSMGRLSDEPG